MKLVYSYDYEGKYIGKTEAELCQITETQRANQKEGDAPIEPIYIMPSYSTELEPPEVDIGEYAAFIDGAWVIKKEAQPEKEPEHIPDYKELRIREYPQYTEYLDGIVKGDAAQIQKYIDDCKAVKLKYPKV